MSTTIDGYMQDALDGYRKELREITLAYKAGLTPWSEYQPKRALLKLMIKNAEAQL